MMLSVIKTKKYWFSLSATLMAISLLSLLFFGFNLGIDFTGGSILEITFVEQSLSSDEIKTILTERQIKAPIIQQTVTGFIVRAQEINEADHQKLLVAFTAALEAKGGSLIEDRFESLGPSIGQELAGKSIKAIIIVLLGIVAYISWVFRHISRPVASWKYGIVALIALFHDVLIVVGVFVLLGHYLDWQINASFIAAILTVLGYSVNDTIIIFDRIRENIKLGGLSFGETIDKSVAQSITRSVNTSFTTLLTLVIIYIFGGESIKEFALALIVGIFIGTYSSIFLASPLLFWWHAKWSK